MKPARLVLTTCFLVATVSGNLLIAQQNNSQSSNSSQASSASSPSPAVGAPLTPGSGTYSIEAEIFAYKSLQKNSQTIAEDVATLLVPAGGQEAMVPGVVIVPSASVILPSFQLWRSNMLVIQTFLDQGNKIPVQECTAKPKITFKSGPSFGGITTGITEGVGVIQSVLGLFASNQNITEFSGTIQDQALITAVARELRSNKNVKVILAPDIFTSWTVDIWNPADSPFVSQLNKLLDELSNLQGYYQCSQLTLGFATQLQQAELAREAAFAKLADPTVKDKKTRKGINDDIDELNDQIDFLRQKIGVRTDPKVVEREADIKTQRRILNSSTDDEDKKKAPQDKNGAEKDKQKTGDVKKAPEAKKKTDDTKNAEDAKAKNDALTKIKEDDLEIMGDIESPVVAKTTLNGANAQALITGIEGYLAGLTGGAVSFTPPSASPSTTTSANSTQGSQTSTQGGTQSNPSQSPAPSGSSNTTSQNASSTTASSTPPIMTILQVDGLARKMGVQVGAGGKWNPDSWHILWVKAMESGGAIISESNIFGSHPYFGGGAVSGYALFELDGSLVCSGNTAAYGGYVKAKDFVNEAKLDPTKPTKGEAIQMLNLGSACTAK